MIPASKAFSHLSIYTWIFIVFGWNLALTKEMIYMSLVLYYQAWWKMIDKYLPRTSRCTVKHARSAWAGEPGELYQRKYFPSRIHQVYRVPWHRSQTKGDALSDDQQQFLRALSKRRCKSEGVILLVGKLTTSCWVQCCDPRRRVDNISPSFAQLRLGWMVAVQMSAYVWTSYQRIGDAGHGNAWRAEQIDYWELADDAWLFEAVVYSLLGRNYVSLGSKEVIAQ